MCGGAPTSKCTSRNFPSTTTAIACPMPTVAAPRARVTSACPAPSACTHHSQHEQVALVAAAHAQILVHIRHLQLPCESGEVLVGGLSGGQVLRSSCAAEARSAWQHWQCNASESAAAGAAPSALLPPAHASVEARSPLALTQSTKSLNDKCVSSPCPHS
jgi:hypothetical protein